MKELLEVKFKRLGAWMDIIASAALLREPISTDVLVGLAVQATQELGVGEGEARPLDDNERREILILGTLLKGIKDVLQLMAERSRPGRQRRVLLEYGDRITRDALMSRMQQLSTEQVAGIMAESGHWAYIVLAPAHQVLLLDLLERASTGAKPTAEQRDKARQLYDSLSASWPAGKRRKGETTS